MRPDRKWLGPAAWGPREARAGDRLPYAAHLDPHTLRLRDGALMQMLAVPGLPFETEDAEHLDHMLAVRDVMLRSALDAGFVLYHHVVRRAVSVALPARFPDAFSAALDEAWQDQLSRRQLFLNEQFLTLVRRPPRGKVGLLERLGRRVGSEADPALRRELSAASEALLSGLAPYGARLLGCPDGRSEPLELLSAIYNGDWQAVAKPVESVDLGHHLPYARVSFGLEALETRRPDGRDVAAILSIKDYPDTTRAGLVDAMLRVPAPMVLTQTYAPADRQVARERIDLAIRRLTSADADALAERGQMSAARDALGLGQAGFGDHHLSVMVRAPTLAALETACSAVRHALSETGAIAVREDVNLEPAFWAQFPGNEAYAVRRAMISSTNAAGFLSLHGFAPGQARGNHWGDAISVLETTSATPRYINFHQGDLGHFTVIGPSGSGKTVVLNFLTAQAQKVAPRTVFFDKDRGAEIFLRAMGAHYTRLVPGQPTGFNPLSLPDTPGNRAFLHDFLACLLDAGDPGELATIADAVETLYDHAPPLRRLSHLGELLAGHHRPRPGDLASRLAPWVAGGAQGWLFDHAQDRLDLDQRVLGFDITALLDTPALRTPTLMYLFHRIEERLDGSPTMILVDEGWKALDDAIFAARLRDWLKTLRKRNAIVGFATQSARDALDSGIAAALVEQTATMIFTPNARARAEDYCEGFGLSAHELELIRALPVASHCFLIRQGQDSAVVRLDMEGMAPFLTVLSGREGSVRQLDGLRAQLGDDPALWLPALTSTDWPGMAEEAA
ncbi:VirB4 family type IV secretion/conjugal transfer ATPase [Novosphingobium terrae]|uniref:VirB4 family type IV secretion/conjugal transfer ATPase n=1 Tax=Novosphingobium terrae TaxID=2726189 RepID=UPI00197E1413|nr:VirB4 family type IV secretion/conjugal transfer ATPase [Novosphingobium terrae]